MGEVVGDLNRRRGLMEGMDDEQVMQMLLKQKCHFEKCLVTLHS
jgi:hypothetical protein